MRTWKFNYMAVSGILILDMEANSFHAVVNRLVDEFGMVSDLSTEMKSGNNYNWGTRFLGVQSSK
jgi:hypothetical protein